MSRRQRDRRVAHDRARTLCEARDALAGQKRAGCPARYVRFTHVGVGALGIVGQPSGDPSGFARVVCSAGQDRRSAQHDRVHPGRVRGNATAEIAVVGRQQGR